MSDRTDGRSLLSTTMSANTTHRGTVVTKYPGTFQVVTGTESRRCTLSGKLRHNADETIAVGDHVEIEPTDAETGIITAVEPRRNCLVRPAPGKRDREHIIVANVDQVVAVFAAARPTPKWNLLDRYLVSAEASGIDVLICISKFDLADEADLDADLAVYRTLGYTVMYTSSETEHGIDDIRSALGGKVSALVGKSGVGKTSLLNAVQPGLGERVGSVSSGDFGKGKHTTNSATLFPLAGGGGIVDTPGIREFGLWQVDEGDVAALFRELAPHIATCRFGAKCTHTSEPGCAVTAAVESGAVHPRRYQSYLKLAQEARKRR